MLTKVMSSDYKIIVNADDLGYSTDINKAIIHSFESRLVARTSLLVNMPGFEDAVRLVHAHPFLLGKVGLHLNLTEGHSLSSRIRSCKPFCDDLGRFIYQRQESRFFLPGQVQEIVYEEMRAQMEKAIRAGIRPTHLDSHHHVHTEWAIMKLMIRLAREYGIRNIRLTRNMGKVQGYSKLLYKGLFNTYLKHTTGIDCTDYFGDIDDLRSFMGKNPLKGKSFEIMVHPSLDEKQELVDLDGNPLEEKLEILADDKKLTSPARDRHKPAPYPMGA
jgi:predicted glycoside hydrolase/deacetylase ChbG (UPF0249 family)